MKKCWVILVLLLLTQALPAQTVPEDSTSRSFDYAVLKYLQEHRTPVGNKVWVTVSNSVLLAPVPTAGVAVSAWCTDNPQTKEIRLCDAGEMAFSELLNFGVTMGAKGLVRRPRPWVAYEGDLVCLQPVRSTSFPSGHTSIAFATATSLTLVYPQWYVAVQAYLWAGAVGYSRMYVGAHYPSDVLVGALVGTASALVVHYVRQTIWEQAAPSAVPPSAVVLPVVISF